MKYTIEGLADNVYHHKTKQYFEQVFQNQGINTK